MLPITIIISASLSLCAATEKLKLVGRFSLTFILADQNLTFLGGAYSNVLKCVKLYVWDNEQCAEYFNPGLIRNSTLCTKPSEEAICKVYYIWDSLWMGSKSTFILDFQGDSGGPAIIYESDGKPTLVSIASFVAAMGCSDYPNGFVRVESFLSWILLHIEGQYDDRNY